MASNSIPKKILVFGATGLIGQHIIEEIYNARSSFEKIGFFTSESTARNKAEEVEDWKKKGVEVIVGDVNSEEDVAKAYQGTLPSSAQVGRTNDFQATTLSSQRLVATPSSFKFPSSNSLNLHPPSTSSTPQSTGLTSSTTLPLRSRNHIN